MQSKTEQALKEDEVAVLKFDDNPSLPSSRNLIGPCEGGGSWQKKSAFFFPSISPPHNTFNSPSSLYKPTWNAVTMVAVQTVNATLPLVSGGWSAEKDFKSVGTLSGATKRNLEPVGPYFLAHARRVCCIALILRFVFIDISIANDLPEPSQPYLLRG